MTLCDIVWNDAYARASLAAEKQCIPLADVLMQPQESRPEIYWRMEAQTGRSDWLGLGENTMEKEGEIALHLTMRLGKIFIRLGSGVAASAPLHIARRFERAQNPGRHCHDLSGAGNHRSLMRAVTGIISP